MFKENEQLLASVKALEESLVELKEEQARCKCTWSGWGQRNWLRPSKPMLNLY